MPPPSHPPPFLKGVPPPSPPPPPPPFFFNRPGMDRQTSDLKRQRLDKEEEIERFKVLRLGLELVRRLSRRLWSWKPHVAMPQLFCRGSCLPHATREATSTGAAERGAAGHRALPQLRRVGQADSLRL